MSSREESSITAIELRVLDPSTFDDIGDGQQFFLPPTDKGKDAWLFLATCFLVEVFVWGKFLYMNCFTQISNYLLWV